MPLMPDKFTYTLGEIPRWRGEADVSLTHENGKVFGNGEPLTEYGIYDAAYTESGKTATAKIFVRRPLCEYLKKAGGVCITLQAKTCHALRKLVRLFQRVSGVEAFPRYREIKTLAE